MTLKVGLVFVWSAAISCFGLESVLGYILGVAGVSPSSINGYQFNWVL